MGAQNKKEEHLSYLFPHRLYEARNNDIQIIETIQLKIKQLFTHHYRIQETLRENHLLQYGMAAAKLPL